ncbi:hypothetical protein MMC28_001770 [Mycoblastus sanguinarius]|nr:hypothetical protein [Mycoblastus sanguinarius]
MTKSTVLSQHVIILYSRLQTLKTKIAFWLAYLREILPQKYDVVHASSHQETQQEKIHIELNGKRLMRGMIHFISGRQAAENQINEDVVKAYKELLPQAFFLADSWIYFYSVTEREDGIGSKKQLDKSFDPIKDVDQIRAYFITELAKPKIYVQPAAPMSEEEFEVWLTEATGRRDLLIGAEGGQ